MMTNICTGKILTVIFLYVHNHILQLKHLSMTCTDKNTNDLINYVHIENN